MSRTATLCPAQAAIWAGFPSGVAVKAGVSRGWLPGWEGDRIPPRSFKPTPVRARRAMVSAGDGLDRLKEAVMPTARLVCR